MISKFNSCLLAGNHIYLNYFICFHIYVEIDPCNSYQLLNDSSRLSTNRQTFPKLCDRDSILPDWYRLTSHNGSNLMLATRCIPLFRCQTLSTGWINGSHPTGM